MTNKNRLQTFQLVLLVTISLCRFQQSLTKTDENAFLDPVHILRNEFGNDDYYAMLKKISKLKEFVGSIIKNRQADFFSIVQDPQDMSQCMNQSCQVEFSSNENEINHCNSLIGEDLVPKSTAICDCFKKATECLHVNLTLNDEKYTEFNGTKYWNDMFALAEKSSQDAVKILSGIKSSVNAQISQTCNSKGIHDEQCELDQSLQMFKKRFSQKEISSKYIENLVLLCQIEATAIVRFIELELKRDNSFFKEDKISMATLREFIDFSPKVDLRKINIPQEDVGKLFQTIDCLSNEFSCQFCQVWTKLQSKSANLAVLVVTDNEFESSCFGLITLMNSFQKHVDSLMFLEQCSQQLNTSSKCSEALGDTCDL